MRLTLGHRPARGVALGEPPVPVVDGVGWRESTNELVLVVEDAAVTAQLLSHAAHSMRRDGYACGVFDERFARVPVWYTLTDLQNLHKCTSRLVAGCSS